MMKKSLLFIVLFLYLQGTAQILNIESYRIHTDTTGWAGKIGFDFSLTKNTKSLMSIGNKSHIQYKFKNNLILLLGQYSLLVSDNDNLIDKSILHLRYNHYFTAKIIGEWFVQGQRNAVSKIDFRGLAGAGLRFKLSKNNKYRYYYGSTLMYETEKTTADITGVLWRWSNYFSFTISPVKSMSFVSTTYYQPAFDNFSDYRIASQNVFFFLLSKHLNFKTTFNYNYDSSPVVDVPKTQYNLSSGIVYIF